jgi:Flp pilus assembly protein TadB
LKLAYAAIEEAKYAVTDDELARMDAEERSHDACANSATLDGPCAILAGVSPAAALLVGVVAFVAFAALLALWWPAAFVFLALWLVATIAYRRRHGR